jgi:hypothetical protein
MSQIDAPGVGAELKPDGTEPGHIEVMIPLPGDGEWPPYPAEIVMAVLRRPGAAELRGVPWFAEGLSRGDLVGIRHDGVGYVSTGLLRAGRNSTVQVVGATASDLAGVAAGLRALGASVVAGDQPPMLAVDVPPFVALDDLTALLDLSASATCAYRVACNRSCVV